MTDANETDIPGPDETDLLETPDPGENITDSNPEDPDDSNVEDTNSPPALDVVEHGFSANPRTYPILEQILSYFPNRSHVYVTATTGGTHATNSYHYRGEAIDVGSASQTYKDQLAAWLYPYYGYITELIHSKSGNHTGWYVKNGRKVSHGYYGSTTTAAHVNHVHFAIASVSQANKMLAVVKKNHAAQHPSAPYVYPTKKPAFPGTLRQGSTGNNVRTLQRRLNIRGYEPKLTEDGSFGSGTTRNLKEFQKFAKLAQDGEMGPKTFNALWDLKVT